MPDLTPAQHAQFGCEYLDELVQALQSNRWCFHDTFGIEKKISQHAEALGIPAPFDRPSKPEHETAQELQIWLKMHDPLTDSGQERLISRMIFAPPPASKGTVLKTVCRPLDEREQTEFRQLVERLKREFNRRGQVARNGQAVPALAPKADPASNLTPAQHATFGCDYLDELLQDLESHDWCWMGSLRGAPYERMSHSASGFTAKINEHAVALGMPAVFGGDLRDTAPGQRDFWLKIADPVKGGESSTLVATLHQPKGGNHSITPYPFDVARQGEFRTLVERLKREFQRHGQLGGNEQALPNSVTVTQAEPDLSDVLQGMDDEHGLPLPELARQIAALADDVDAGNFVTEPLRHNAAELWQAARLQFRDTSMEHRETEPGRWQWMKRNPASRPMNERRLEHHLSQAVAVLSDVQDGRKAADTAAKLRAIAKGIEMSAANPGSMSNAMSQPGAPMPADIAADGAPTAASTLSKAVSNPVSDKHADGPTGPNLLWYNGKSTTIEPIPWKLLDHAWRQRTAKEPDVIEAVWGHDSAVSAESDGPLKSAIKKANRALDEVSCPLHLGRKNGFITLA